MSIIDYARVRRARRLAHKRGWTLLKCHDSGKPRRYGEKRMRYLLGDEHGVTYFETLTDVERKLSVRSNHVRS
jgi:hypothetical protein